MEVNIETGPTKQQQIKSCCVHGFRGTVSYSIFRDHLFISNKKLITRWEYPNVTGPPSNLFAYFRLSIDIHKTCSSFGLVDNVHDFSRRSGHSRDAAGRLRTLPGESGRFWVPFSMTMNLVLVQSSPVSGTVPTNLKIEQYQIKMYAVEVV